MHGASDGGTMFSTYAIHVVVSILRRIERRYHQAYTDSEDLGSTEADPTRIIIASARLLITRCRY
jgi:hypothetical protein